MSNSSALLPITDKKSEPVANGVHVSSEELSYDDSSAVLPTTADNKLQPVAGLHISFEELSYSIPVGKKKDDEPLQILRKLNGCFQSGKLTALMGPSGSGKTTLLDILAGRKNFGSIEGNIYYQDRKPTKDDYRLTVGYVEQFDTLVGELTVENMLRYTAELKLPRDTTKTEREERVEEVLQMLDLESCRSTVIGDSLLRGISGGQAKRVNIGLALITRPPILFLDEPTSGLDSRTANEVVELLRQLAHDGNRTVICTIHSPTGHAFGLFDDLHMIHQGQTVYDGSVSAAQTYFENHGNLRDPDASLPEWLVDLTSDMESIQNRKANDRTKNSTSMITNINKSFIDLYQSSEIKLVADKSRQSLVSSSEATTTTNKKKVNKNQTPSEFSKLVTLLKYRGVAHYKDGQFLGVRFGDKVMFSILILTLYFGIGEKTDSQSVASMSTLLFFIAALCGFGATAFVPALNIERKLFYRELADGCYHPATYYCSKFLEEAFIALLTSGVFCVIVFFGLKMTGNFGVFFLAYYLTTLIGVILAYAVASIVPSLEAANALLPTYVTTCLFFGGLFIVFDKIPSGWVWFSWTSFIRYSWSAMMLNNYPPDAAVSRIPVFTNGEESLTVLEFYGMDEGPIMNSAAACLGCLTLLLGIFSMLGMLALIYIRHEKR